MPEPKVVIHLYDAQGIPLDPGTRIPIDIGKKFSYYAEVENSSETGAWELPQGTTVQSLVKNYQADTSSATVTPYTAEDLSNSLFAGYWIQPVEAGTHDVTVYYKVTIDDEEYTSHIIFEIFVPAWSLEFTQRSAAVMGILDNDPKELSYGRPDDDLDGIVIHAELDEGVPGSLALVQLVTELHATRICMATGQQSLDEEDPLLDAKTTLQYPTWILDNGAGSDFEDSPAIKLIEPAKTDDYSIDTYNFTSYICWRKPGIANSIWVPLKKVTWGWKASAQQTTLDNWELWDQPPAEYIPKEESDPGPLPTWSKNVLQMQKWPECPDCSSSSCF